MTHYSIFTICIFYQGATFVTTLCLCSNTQFPPDFYMTHMQGQLPTFYHTLCWKGFITLKLFYVLGVMVVCSIATTYPLTVPITHHTTSKNQQKFEKSLTTHSDPLALLGMFLIRLFLSAVHCLAERTQGRLLTT